MRQFFLWSCGFLFLLSFGCDDSINPSAPFEPRMVVYSVLSTASDTQYVRVYTSYNPPGNNPLLIRDEQSIADATVTMTDGATTIPFRFTSISRPDTSRYTSAIGLYYAYPFRPQDGKEYTLNVSSPTLGQAVAKTRIPGNGSVNCTTINGLYHQDELAFFGKPIYVQFTLNNQAKAQLVRFFLVYTTENPGDEGKEHYYEVPAFWKIIDYNYEIHKRIYAVPTRRTAPLPRGNQTLFLTMTYAFPTYNESLYEIGHVNFNVHFKRAVFHLIQFDEQWYKYYAAANLFQDRLAVRVDPPDYSNVQGGSGMFGSFHVDSSVVPLPDMLRGYPPGSSR